MEIQIGKNGWITCRLNRGYNNPFPEKDMEVILNPSEPADVVPWETACNNVAQDIYSKHKKLFLAFGGGIDGEGIANTFLRLGIPFTPLIFKIDTLHDADTWWAERWSKQNGVTPVILDKLTIKEYASKMVTINQRYCTRTASGPALIRYCADYAESQGGVLVTGAGFPEHFPDENLDYMKAGQRYPVYNTAFHGPGVGEPMMEDTFYDQTLVHADRTPKAEGFLFHEPDIVNAFLLEGHPWNFLSWTPEIVLSYICARDYSLTSADDKARITGCVPRPKIAGVHDYVYRNWPLLRRWVFLRRGIGKSECDFLGTVPELKKLLGNIDG